MKSILIIFSVSLFFSCHINENSVLSRNDEMLSQDSLKCNIDIIVQLNKSLENPNISDLLNFLFTFDETCDSNVEYSEFSNEVLFMVVEKHPKLVIDLILNNDVRVDLILKELRSPVSDKYNEADVKQLIERLEDIEENKH